MRSFSVIFQCWLMLFSFRAMSQPTTPLTGKVKNADFDKTIASILHFYIPIVSVAEALQLPDAIYLDARETAEFNLSHIPGARYTGCDLWSPQSIQSISKDKTIIVYCSVGYRSEKIGAKIKELGYRKVYNLYGSIFEWVNEGHPIESGDGKPTLQLHTFNKAWSKWVTNKDIQKFW